MKIKIITPIFFFFIVQFFFAQTAKNDTIKVATKTTVSAEATINDTVKAAATPSIGNPKLKKEAKSLNNQLKSEKKALEEAKKKKKKKKSLKKKKATSTNNKVKLYPAKNQPEQ